MNLGAIVDDDERAVTAFRYGVRYPGRDYADLTAAYTSECRSDLQVQLSFQNQEGFVKRMQFIGVRLVIHSNDLEFGARSLADHRGMPCLGEGRCESDEIYMYGHHETPWWRPTSQWLEIAMRFHRLIIATSAPSAATSRSVKCSRSVARRDGSTDWSSSRVIASVKASAAFSRAV